MRNYRPKANIVLSSLVLSGTAVLRNVTTSTWGMALLEGTAVSPDGNSVMASGAIDVWEYSGSIVDSIGSPTHTTFTDALGQYGVTVKANTKLLIKFYGR
jgi:hypothetical protein